MKVVRAIAMLAALLAGSGMPAVEPAKTHELAKLERSFGGNASLASPGRGYWGQEFLAPKPPTETEIANAARVLTGDAAAKRLYLIYHHEWPLEQAREVFLARRKAFLPEVDLVPTLVLRMYDKPQTQVFDAGDLESLCDFFKSGIKAHRIAVYDIAAGRAQGAEIGVLGRHFQGGLLRVGLQPDEPLGDPFVDAVEDTWSAFCHGLTNADWTSPGFCAGPWHEVTTIYQALRAGRRPIAKAV